MEKGVFASASITNQRPPSLVCRTVFSGFAAPTPDTEVGFWTADMCVTQCWVSIHRSMTLIRFLAGNKMHTCVVCANRRRVAEIEGIDSLYVDRRMAGLSGNTISDEQHGRFAAAVLLDWLVADHNSIHTLEKAWGQQNTLTRSGEWCGQYLTLQYQKAGTCKRTVQTTIQKVCKRQLGC